MFSRRRFIEALSLGGLTAAAGQWKNPLPNWQSKFGKIKPVVIATWDNRKATSAAWETMNKTGYALDAVEAGIRIPEADPKDTSVGYGGFPDCEGLVTLDACIMDELGRAGSVACLQHIMHPISVARRVMENTPHVLLTGEGALRFALSEGFEKTDLLTENAKKAWQDWLVKSKYEPKANWERHDTIGLVALDPQGRIAGGCSTSGMAFKMHGRVGDSPILGAGMYADQEAGAAAATGLGELLLRTLGCYLTVEEMRRGKHPQKAVEFAIRRVAQKCAKEVAEGQQIGIVAIDNRGRFGAYAIQKGFNFAVFQEGKNQLFEADYLIK